MFMTRKRQHLISEASYSSETGAVSPSSRAGLTHDPQASSIKDALHFLACCPHKVTRIGLFERGDRYRLDRCPWPFSKHCQLFTSLSGLVYACRGRSDEDDSLL